MKHLQIQGPPQKTISIPETTGPYPLYGWAFLEEIPEKFRKDPGNALRAFPGIPLTSTAGIPQTLQLKAFEASRAFPEFSPPQYGWGRFFFQKWFRRGPLRAGHGIPSSTGGISDYRSLPALRARNPERVSVSQGRKARDPKSARNSLETVSAISKQSILSLRTLFRDCFGHFSGRSLETLSGFPALRGPGDSGKGRAGLPLFFFVVEVLLMPRLPAFIHELSSTCTPQTSI